MTVYWTDDALEQVMVISQLLAVTSPQFAERIVTNLFDRVRPLADHPNMGSVYKKAGLTQVRELLVKPYRIMYYVGRKQVDIIAVLHQSQR